MLASHKRCQTSLILLHDVRQLQIKSGIWFPKYSHLLTQPSSGVISMLLWPARLGAATKVPTQQLSEGSRRLLNLANHPTAPARVAIFYCPREGTSGIGK